MAEILVNCDDLGMHPAINEGILDVLTGGVVTSCSLLAGGAAYDDAVRRLAAAGIRRVGAHLAITAEYPAARIQPVLPRSAVPSLLRQDGHFYADVAFNPDPIDKDELVAELEAQIAKIKASGLTLTHLDGHMFFYEPERDGLPVLPLLEELADRHGLPLRRSHRLHFIWEGYDGIAERTAFYDALLAGYAEDAAELIIHPAARRAELASFTEHGERRWADYVYFTGPDLRARLQERGVAVIGWGDARRQRPRASLACSALDVAGQSPSKATARSST